MTQIDPQQTPELNHEQMNVNQTIVMQRNRNGLGIAGFVTTLVAAIIFWSVLVTLSSSASEFVLSLVSAYTLLLPLISAPLWILGFIFSVVGIFKNPRKLAVAGVIISLINVISGSIAISLLA